MIELKATFKRSTTDEWGESTITFRVPQSHKQQVNELTGLIGKVLHLNIKQD